MTIEAPTADQKMRDYPISLRQTAQAVFGNDFAARSRGLASPATTEAQARTQHR